MTTTTPIRPHRRPARVGTSPLDRLSPEKRILVENAIQHFLAYARQKRALYTTIHDYDDLLDDAQPAPVAPPKSPQLPHPNLKRAGKGSLTQPILDALTSGPLTLGELVKSTGLTNKGIKNALGRMQGKYVEKLSNKSRGNKWAILGSEPVVIAPPVTIRERIEAYLVQHGPTTARGLIDALGEKARTVTGTLQSPLCRAEKVGMDGDKILWGLPEASGGFDDR